MHTRNRKLTAGTAPFHSNVAISEQSSDGNVTQNCYMLGTTTKVSSSGAVVTVERYLPRFRFEINIQNYTPRCTL